MSFINHAASIAPVPSLMPRRVMLAASVLAAAVTGTASAGEPAAADFFVAKVMVVQTSDVAPPGQPGSVPARMAHGSAQDQFVDQVLRGRLPHGGAASRSKRPADEPTSWADVGFLQPMSQRR